MTETLVIEEFDLPGSAEGAEAAEFLEIVALNDAVCVEDAGTTDLNRAPVELLSDLRGDADAVQRTFVARDGGRIVGCLFFGFATAEPTSTQFDLVVPSAHAGRGLEASLLARAEAETRAIGRAVMQTWTLHDPASAAPTLTPATGWGRVPRTRLSDALVADGYALEQVERNSAFDLQRSMEDVQRRLDQATVAAGADYRLVDWTVPTPPEYVDGYAWALSRMSTDVPAGALEVDEETWDADRVRRREARIVDARQAMSVAAAVHVPTGQVAAFNELVIGADRTEVTHQYNTLVLREHRGHRLGMLVKCANLLRWRQVAPASPKVSTFNAEENRPMLDINEAIGFVPVSYAGAWQKRLT